MSAKSSNVTKAIIWVLVVVGLGLLVYGLAVLGSNDDDSDSHGSDSGEVRAISDEDVVRGNRDAENVLIEFGDFQCPACRNAAPLVDQIESELGEDLAIVYRNFPLSIHANAREAAAAAEAAHLQGQWLAMHDLLFDNQAIWANERNPEDIFEGYAEGLGLDMDQYREDFDSDEVDDKINEDLRDGRRGNVTSTPTYFLNGEKLTISSFEEFLDTVRGVVNDSTSDEAPEGGEGSEESSEEATEPTEESAE